MKHLRIADWGVLAGASGLLVTLFLDWYDIVVPDTGLGLIDGSVDNAIDQISTTGWSSLGWVPLLLLGICIAAGLLLCALLAVGAGDAYTLPPAVVLATLGLPALIVLLIVVALQPGLGTGVPNDAVELTAAGWIGIACAVLLVGGGLFSLKDERMTGPGRVYTPPPARPAPPA